MTTQSSIGARDVSNLTKLNAPSPTVIMPMEAKPALGDRLSGAPYASIRNADGSDTLVSPNATIGEALDNSPHPYAPPSKADLAHQDRMLRQAKDAVDARHDDETSALLDAMRRKAPAPVAKGSVEYNRGARK